jgi:hypothetical protein
MFLKCVTKSSGHGRACPHRRQVKVNTLDLSVVMPAKAGTQYSGEANGGTDAEPDGQ